MYEHRLWAVFNNIKKYVLKGSEKSTSLNLSALNISKKPLWTINCLEWLFCCVKTIPLEKMAIVLNVKINLCYNQLSRVLDTPRSLVRVIGILASLWSITY